MHKTRTQDETKPGDIKDKKNPARSGVTRNINLTFAFSRQTLISQVSRNHFS